MLTNKNPLKSQLQIKIPTWLQETSTIWIPTKWRSLEEGKIRNKNSQQAQVASISTRLRNTSRLNNEHIYTYESYLHPVRHCWSVAV
jgi:hypothetical protein